jgi:hypothetical protein
MESKSSSGYIRVNFVEGRKSMTKKDFDKLFGKVVRMHTLNEHFVVLVDKSDNNWYYCFDEFSNLEGNKHVAIRCNEIESVDVLSEEEAIVWRIENNV